MPIIMQSYKLACMFIHLWFVVECCDILCPVLVEVSHHVYVYTVHVHVCDEKPLPIITITFTACMCSLVMADTYRKCTYIVLPLVIQFNDCHNLYRLRIVTAYSVRQNHTLCHLHERRLQLLSTLSKFFHMQPLYYSY